MKQTSIVIITIAILLALMVGSVGAYNITTSGRIEQGKAVVELNSQSVVITDAFTGITVTSNYKIDNTEVSPIKDISKTLDEQKLIQKPQTGAKAEDDVHFSFETIKHGVKETILLNSPHTLSFDVSHPTNTKIQPTGWGAWQIVRKDIPIEGGIEIAKPFGVDSNGNNISMDYTLSGNTLTLVIDSVATNGIGKNMTIHSIVYPLVIDPTWQVFSPWGERSSAYAVSPNNSLYMTGGYDGVTYKNDVWISINNGINWTQQTPSAAWTTRYGNAAIVTGNGSVIVTGGSRFTSYNDTWMSVDDGVSWTQLTSSSGWVKRDSHAMVITKNQSIVLTGGYDTSFRSLADTWMSTNNGTSWSLVNASGGWNYSMHSMVVTPNNKFVVFGGVNNIGGVGDTNDTWMSTNNGTTWSMVNASGGWQNRSISRAGVITSDGSIILSGGWGVTYYNDTWMSNDDGATWSRQTASANWSARQTDCVITNDNVIILFGGFSDGDGYNDIWWSYDKGITWKQAPAPTFTTNVTSGITPFAVQFNETSYNMGTSWKWNATNVTGNNVPFTFSTSENATYTFGYFGNYSISLNSTNAGGSSMSHQTTWVNATTYQAVSDFTIGNPTTLASNAVTFTPLGSDATTYNWSFGDGTWTNSTTNIMQSHTYTTTGIYTPKLYAFKTGVAVNITTKLDAVGINSMKVYPIVDGYVSRTTSGTFAAIRAGAGTAVDSSATSLYSRLSAAAGASDYSRLDRGIEIYDTATYPSGVYITNASLNLYGNAKTNGFGTSPNLVVTNVTALASLTSIASSDYDKAGIQSLSNSNVSYAGYNTAAYNTLYLKNDTTTIGIMNLTGKFPLMLRTSWDADNAPPAWVSSASLYFQPLTNDSATTRPYLLLNFSAIPLYFVANTTVGMIGANNIQFNDSSTSDGGTYNWSFGDGSYSTTRNNTHTYLTQGLFSVNFTSPYPGSNYLLKSNYINISAPSFTCTPTSGAAPLFTTCTDNSAILTGNVQWIWGDGDSTNGGTTESHTYAAGTYSPQLQSPIGVGAITTNVNYIGSGVYTPVADFTSNVTSVAAGGYVQFNDTSTNIPTSWKWSFAGGTGSDSVLQNPTYQFNTVGNFSVNLTATNAVGFDSEVKPLYIRVYPAGWVPGMTAITSVDFTVSPYQYVNLGGSLTFNGTVVGGTPTSYKWDFVGGTGSNATTLTPTYAFTPVGNRTVNFTAYNAISSASMRKVDYIQVIGVGNPYANYIATPTSLSPGGLVLFTDLSLKGNTTGEIYNWSFGDGLYSPTPYSAVAGDVQHVYAYAGVYDTNLTITNFNGTSYMYKSQYITVSVAEAKLNSLYMHETRFIVVDTHGQPIATLPVTAQMMNSSNDGTNWYSTLFGISSLATPIEGTLVTGLTDSYGAVVFTMDGVGLYELNCVDASRGINKKITVHPSESDYTIVIPTTASAAIPSIGDFITGNLTANPIGANVYLNMSYNDTGLQTTNVNYFIVFPNQTTFYTKDFAGTPLLNQSVTFGYPVVNNRGDAYVWGYSATNSVWGLVNRSQGITLKGVDGILFNPFVYKDRW